MKSCLNKFSSSGLLFLYLAGTLEPNQTINVCHVDSYQDPIEKFYDQVKAEKAMLMENDFEIFCVCGIPPKIDLISNIIRVGIRGNCERLIHEKSIQRVSSALDCMANTFYRLVQEHIFSEQMLFPREYYKDNDDWTLYCVWAGKGPEDDQSSYVDTALSIWMDYENPILMGRQLMINSFLLRDLVGRRVI